MVEKSEQSNIEEKMKQYYSNQIKPPRSLFTYERDNVIKEGDTVLFFEKMDQMKQVTVTRGQIYNVSKGGAIKHDDLIDNKERFGSRVLTSNKRASCFVLKPNTDLYTRSLA